MNITSMEPELREFRPPAAAGLGLPDGLVWPRYSGRSVGNLAATVCQALGVPKALPQGALSPLAPGLVDDLFEGVRRVVLLVMDAMGWVALQRVMAGNGDLVFHDLAERGRLIPLTTTFLSTTNSVLSSIFTGRPPAQHGLLAYEMYLREWLMAVESIGFSSPWEPFANTLLKWGFEPEKFLPVPSVAQRLVTQGVATVSVTHKSIATTPLSRMHFRGAKETRGYSYASDFWVSLRQVLRAHRSSRLFLAGYWPAVDTLAHKFGPEDETGEAEIRSIALLMEDIFLKHLPAEDCEGTLLLMTADHGQIATPATSTIVYAQHPLLRDALWMPPIGEGRVPFFYVRDGAYDRALCYLQDRFGEQFVFLSRQQVLDSGLLGPGPIYSEVPFRLGNIIGIATGDGAFARTPDDAKRLPGRHGGLTAEEMLVPLLAVRLDA